MTAGRRAGSKRQLVLYLTDPLLASLISRFAHRSLDPGWNSSFQLYNWKHKWTGMRGWQERKIVASKSDAKKVLLAITPI